MHIAQLHVGSHAYSLISLSICKKNGKIWTESFSRSRMRIVFLTNNMSLMTNPFWLISEETLPVLQPTFPNLQKYEETLLLAANVDSKRNNHDSSSKDDIVRRVRSTVTETRWQIWRSGGSAMSALTGQSSTSKRYLVLIFNIKKGQIFWHICIQITYLGIVILSKKAAPSSSR